MDLASLRTGFTPFGMRAPSAPPASGWTRPNAPPRKRSRWLTVTLLLGAMLAASSWTAVRHVPWFGPLIADTLRAVIGGERVTALEEAVASVEDHVERVTNDGKARSLGDATPAGLLSAVESEPLPAALGHAPKDVAPLYPAVAAPDDGAFRPLPTRFDTGSAIYRTMLHPDPERSYAELFVFALDLSQVSVHPVAGSVEPKADRPLPGVTRPGLIPEADRPRLLAAFNGGFKAEHGEFGMRVDGAELLAAKGYSCTFAGTGDGSLAIGTFSKLAAPHETYAWWRQTPSCMVEDGALHPGLRSQTTKNWGATIDGKTVIRRSAVGLSPDGKTLFVGISNSTTARAMALGMQRAGAVTVAQLDVNFSFPRFLVYEPNGATGALTAVGAVNGLLYTPDEYLGHASSRDFFYVTAR